MSLKNGNINFKIILFLLSVALCILVYTSQDQLSLSPFIYLLAPIIFLIAFTYSDFALLLLIFFMLLSPEFILGGVYKRNVVLRLDDIFIFVTFFGWMTKTAINKELGLIKVTPINRWIAIYMFIYIVSSLLGVITGYLNFNTSMFYLLKYFEYFLLYFMVVNCLKNTEQIKLFVYSFLIVGLVVSIYACFMHFSGSIRVTAPFEGRSGEPNTLGGYLVLLMMVTLGLILNLPHLKRKIILALGMCVAFPAFLFTLSRSSWVSFIPAYIVLLFLSRKGKFLLLIVSLILVLQFSVIFPTYVYDRIKYTFETQQTRSVFGKDISIDESSAARVDTWKNSIKHWARSPIIGHGASSAGSVVDNQYMRVLIEGGILGLLAFLIILISVFRNSIRTLHDMRDAPFEHGLTAGFIAGFIGLLVHALGAATFILIRIMEPFWFLAAIVITLPQLKKDLGEQWG